MRESHSTRRLLVVHWDGADWSRLRPLVEDGHMPTLARLIERGARYALEPEAGEAPALWTTLTSDADGHALWHRLSASGRRTHVVGWPYGAAATPDGIEVQPSFGDGPAASEAVVPTSVAEALTPYLLGTDEITAAHLTPFAPFLADTTPADLGPELRLPLNMLAEALAACASRHAAATELMEHHAWDALVVHYDLLARLGHAFGRFADDAQPVPDVMRRAFEHVLPGAARFHDMMLERLLTLAGDDAAVVLVGLARADALTRTPATGFVCTHRLSLAAPPRCVADVGEALHAALGITGNGAVRPAPDLDPSGGTPSGVRAAQFDRAKAALQRGAPKEALELLTTLYAERLDPAHGMQLLRCQLRLKRPGDARATLDRLLAERSRRMRGVEHPNDDVLPAPLALLQANVLRAEKRYAEAYDTLKTAEAQAPRTALFHRRLGSVYLQLHAWSDAERVLRRAVEIAPRFPAGYRWLAVALIRQGEYERALEAATRAAALRTPFPAAHYHRAIALMRLERYTEAAEAAETCVAQSPAFSRARYLLTQLYRDHLDQPARAMEHLLALPHDT